MDELKQIQFRLKAHKGQFNKFGNYNYRSCEDILEAVKPLLEEFDCTLTLSDDIQMVGDRIYVKATATIINGKAGIAGGEAVSVSAFAREAATKKGMDDSQITGTASSYARKYALNGLFLIDDTKDADTMDNRATNKIEPIKPYQVERLNAMKTRLMDMPEAEKSVKLIEENIETWNTADATTWIKKIGEKYGV